MEIRILGQPELLDDSGQPVELSPKLAALLAVLVIHLGEQVPTEEVVAWVWDKAPQRETVYRYIAELRSTLASASGGSAELHRKPGYQKLTVADTGTIDHQRFLAQLAAGHQEADSEQALARFAAALAEARGRPLEGLPGLRLGAFRKQLSAKVHEVRSKHAELLLALGRPGEAIEALDEYLLPGPGDERLLDLWAEAMDAAGRGAEIAEGIEARLAGRPATADLKSSVRRAAAPAPVGAEPAAADDERLWEAVFEPEYLLREDHAPSELLQAEYHIVGYERPDDLLPRLAGWLGGTAPVRVRLLTGPGGRGKTRLGIELIARARAQGWRAGLVAPGVDAGLLERAVAETGPLLLVVDYAEARTDQILAALRKAGSRHEGGGALRVLLLARATGSWLDTLHREKDPELLRLLRDMPSEPVGALAEDARVQQFRRAMAAFLPYVPSADAKQVTMPPDLDDDRYDRVLDVHAAALAAILDTTVPGPAPSTDDPLERIRIHEERYWLTTVDQFKLPDPHLPRLRWLVATATLFGGADLGAARRVLAALRTFDELGADVVDRYLAWLEELYPGPARLNPLRPDRLGEDLAAATMGRDVEAVRPVAAAADDAQVTRALTVLGRASQRHEVRDLLTVLIEPDVLRRAPIAVTVATQVDSPALVDVLTEVSTDDEVTEAIVGRLPDRSLVLAALAVEMTRALLRIQLRSSPVDEPFVAEIRHNLALRLTQVGEYDEAITLFGSAVRTYRRLAASEPDDQVELATSLSSMATAYAHLGQYEDACLANRQSVEILEAIVASPSPELTFAPAELKLLLATSRTNLGSALSSCGEDDEAAESISRAVTEARDLLEELGGHNASKLLAQLATSLDVQCSVYAADSRFREAKVAGGEAVEIHRRLDEDEPDQFRPDLVRSLFNLAGMYAETGDWEPGAELATESVELARSLVDRHGVTHTEVLAGALNNAAALLRRSGDVETALSYATEAVALYRPLASERPETELDGLAAALHNLGDTLEQVDRLPDALEAYEEAAGTYRKLEESRGAVFLPALAGALLGLANARRAVDKPGTAREIAIEVLALLNRSMHVERVEIRRKLADAHAIAAAAALDLGDFAAAERHGLLAAAAYRDLAPDDDLDFQDLRADALLRAAVARMDGGRMRAALPILAEAETVLRELVDQSDSPERDDHLGALAGVLLNSARCTSENGQDQQALAQLQEALDIRRNLVDSTADTQESLAEVLNNLADTLCDVGDFAEAAVLATEAVEIAERLLAQGAEDSVSIAVYALTTRARAVGRTDLDEAFRTLVRAWQLADSPELRKLTLDGLDQLVPSRRKLRRMWQSASDLPFPRL